MDEKDTGNARPGTARQRYILPSATVTEITIDGNTTPEQIDNLIAQVLYLDGQALESKLIPANQVQGKAAQDKSGVALTRDDNLVFHVVSMDVVPAANGKASVALFGDTHKQPRDDYATMTISNWKVEELKKIFLPYYEFSFAKAVSLKVDFMVEYYNSSKLNTQGNPYKNFKALHVKDDAAAPELMEAPAPPPPVEPEVPAPQDDIPF